MSDVKGWRKFWKVHGDFQNCEMIEVLVDHNPKRPGPSRERFWTYQENMTVGAYIAEYEARKFVKPEFRTPRKTAMADLTWDVWHGFIRIVPNGYIQIAPVDWNMLKQLVKRNGESSAGQ